MKPIILGLISASPLILIAHLTPRRHVGTILLCATLMAVLGFISARLLETNR